MSDNLNNRHMIKAKTMTAWEDEDYDYPLPDVSHFSRYPLELAKFHCMRAYFSNSFIADENGNFSFKPWIDLCIRLLKHIVKEGRNISDRQALHVNVRNVQDIVDYDDIDNYLNAPMPVEKKDRETDKAWYGRKIYVLKMERLYYKIRLYKMQDWWEP